MPTTKQNVTLIFRSQLAGGMPSHSLQYPGTVTYDDSSNPGATGTVEPFALSSDQLAAIGTQSVSVLLQAVCPSPEAFKNIDKVIVGLTGTGTKPAFVLPDQQVPPITVQALLDFEQSRGGN